MTGYLYLKLAGRFNLNPSGIFLPSCLFLEISSLFDNFSSSQYLLNYQNINRSQLREEINSNSIKEASYIVPFETYEVVHLKSVLDPNYDEFDRAAQYNSELYLKKTLFYGYINRLNFFKLSIPFCLYSNVYKFYLDHFESHQLLYKILFVRSEKVCAFISLDSLDLYIISTEWDF